MVRWTVPPMLLSDRSWLKVIHLKFWSLDAFQLDVKIDDKKYSINGMEESEGYFDITNDQIVLKGTNLGLNDGIELGFAEHEGLPNKIKSFATYKVANL